MTAVDHESLFEILFREILLGVGNAFGIVVDAVCTTAQNHKAVFITNPTDSSDQAGLGDGKEAVRVSDCANAIDRDTSLPSVPLLKLAGKERPGGQLPMQLAPTRSGLQGIAEKSCPTSRWLEACPCPSNQRTSAGKYEDPCLSESCHQS